MQFLHCTLLILLWEKGNSFAALQKLFYIISIYSAQRNIDTRKISNRLIYGQAWYILQAFLKYCIGPIFFSFLFCFVNMTIVKTPAAEHTEMPFSNFSLVYCLCLAALNNKLLLRTFQRVYKKYFRVCFYHSK